MENQGGGLAHTDDQASGVQGIDQVRGGRGAASDPIGAAQGTSNMNSNLIDKADLSKNKVDGGVV
jgi:hypothetical protein